MNGVENVIQFIFFVGTIVCIVLMIVVKIMIVYGFPPQRPSGHQNHQHGFLSNTTLQQFIESIKTVPQHSIDTVELGLDEATLRNYPKLIYAQAKLHKGNSTSSYCSICLADYNDTDVLLLSPNCDHLFHLKCVDSWLRLHATCPVCRNLPFAEVATSLGVTSMT
ncbi:RING-H2 finger protein ATL70-like [Quercus lobata]|uniref:RING-H2 finger protein ATL70-like n=1 Tax=Quercus lobata TaxID=97700 RepID=UPI00124681F0|nr:RING-H2 finger protein ATL70-like [Quercus lobata]